MILRLGCKHFIRFHLVWLEMIKTLIAINRFDDNAYLIGFAGIGIGVVTKANQSPDLHVYLLLTIVSMCGVLRDRYWRKWKECGECLLWRKIVKNNWRIEQTKQNRLASMPHKWNSNWTFQHEPDTFRFLYVYVQVAHRFHSQFLSIRLTTNMDITTWTQRRENIEIFAPRFAHSPRR